MYYKIISEGQIIDASTDLNYVKWQEKNRLFLSCDAESSDGIISSNGADIYLLTEKETGEDLPVAEIVEIDEEEYLALKEEIDAGNSVEQPGEQEGETNTHKTRLKRLEEEVEELRAANEMLTECLLEMSEIVYG